ncbi:MAG: DUF302 domain-containing protein [Rhodomicrobium sp.]
MSDASAAGLVSVRSPLPLAETIGNLLVAVERRGMMVFARVDHAKCAADAHIALRPTQLFIFGYPEAEAPLIAENPLFALDFPQRLLVREDEHGQVLLQYRDPAALGRRLGAGAGALSKLEAIGVSLAGIAAEAGGAKHAARA